MRKLLKGRWELSRDEEQAAWEADYRPLFDTDERAASLTRYRAAAWASRTFTWDVAKHSGGWHFYDLMAERVAPGSASLRGTLCDLYPYVASMDRTTSIHMSWPNTVGGRGLLSMVWIPRGLLVAEYFGQRADAAAWPVWAALGTRLVELWGALEPVYGVNHALAVTDCVLDFLLPEELLAWGVQQYDGVSAGLESLATYLEGAQGVEEKRRRWEQWQAVARFL